MSKLILGHAYDIGGRKVYEDRTATDAFTTPGGLNISFAIVADGVGGESKGERAAQLAIDSVQQYIKHQSQEPDVPTMLIKAVQHAARQVHSEHTQNDRASTTLVIAVVQDEKTLYVANVGDSRVYLVRKDKLTQLTMDHTFATVMVWQGRLSKEAAQSNPRAEAIMRALGPQADMPVDIGFYVATEEYKVAQQQGKQGLPLQDGDSILVCSDGLIKTSPTGGQYATDAEIIRTLNSQEGEKAAQMLVSFALGRNVDDNVSVALMQMPDNQRAIRGRQQMMLAGAGILLAILLIGGLIAWASGRRADSTVADTQQAATEQAANFQMTLDAALAANSNQEGEVDAETQALIDAATREAQTATDAIVAAENADNSIPTAITAAANSDGTTACSEGDFLFEIGDYVLTPARGTPIEEVDGPMTVAYPISVTSDCVLGNMMLKSLKTNQRLTPQLLDANGNEVAQLAGNSSGTILVNFENSQDAITVDEEWVLEVRDRDGFSVSLDAQPHLTLFIDGQIETWLVDSGAKSPTNTPEPPPTADNSVAQPQPTAQTQNNNSTNQQQPNIEATRTRQAAEANYAATQTQAAINAADFNAQQTRQAAEAANAQAANAQATQTQNAARATYNAEQTRVGQPTAAATVAATATRPPHPPCDTSDPAGDADGDGKSNQEEITIPGLDPCDPDSDDDGFGDNGDLCPTVPGPNTGCPGGGDDDDDDNEAPSTPGAKPTLAPPPPPPIDP